MIEPIKVHALLHTDQKLKFTYFTILSIYGHLCHFILFTLEKETNILSVLNNEWLCTNIKHSITRTNGWNILCLPYTSVARTKP